MHVSVRAFAVCVFCASVCVFVCFVLLCVCVQAAKGAAAVKLKPMDNRIPFVLLQVGEVPPEVLTSEGRQAWTCRLVKWEHTSRFPWGTHTRTHTHTHTHAHTGRDSLVCVCVCVCLACAGRLERCLGNVSELSTQRLSVLEVRR